MNDRSDLHTSPTVVTVQAAGAVTVLRPKGTPRTMPSLRELAGSGELRTAAGSTEARRLRSEAFGIVLPLVWGRHTRPLETRKGHRRCAAGICFLDAECADGFTDDAESVVTALLAYSRPIANLEGWITARMANAIKDGNRIRRSRDMGAQQRVRVPVRLAARLGNDPWLVALANRVLQWAGVRRTAGTQLWPLGAWAEDRATLVGPAGDLSAIETVAAELAVVLRTMREWDPAWYAGYVEQPLGRKWAPVAADTRHDAGQDVAPVTHLELVPQHERDDARLAEAAAACLAAIRSGIAAGGEARQVVAEALSASFLAVGSLWAECERTPLADADLGAVVATVLANQDALDRVVGTALDIVA